MRDRDFYPGTEPTLGDRFYRYQALWSDGVVESWSAENDEAALRDVAHWTPDARSGAHVEYVERVEGDIRTCVPVSP